MNDEMVMEVFNALVMINNDRIENYRRIINNTYVLGQDQKELFEEIIEKSKGYKQQLIEEINLLDDSYVENKTTGLGKIYRAWMEVSVPISGNDIKSILRSSKFIEDATLRAYNAALSSSVPLSSDQLQLIADQQSGIREIHHLIVMQLDTYNAID